MASNFVAIVIGCRGFGAQENNICHRFHFSPIYLPWRDGTRCKDLVFSMMSFKPAFSLPYFILIKKFLSSSLFPAVKVVSSVYLRLWYFFHQSWLYLWVIQPGIWHDVLCIEVKEAGWQYTALMYSLPSLEPVHCPMPNSKRTTIFSFKFIKDILGCPAGLLSPIFKGKMIILHLTWCLPKPICWSILKM